MNINISIIIPIYNVEQLLPMCLNSILKQSYCEFEVILVNDGSSDRSGDICDEYAALDNRVKVIHKSNGGVSSARNMGLDIALGEYICFIDSDDWIASSYLSDFQIDKYHADLYISGAIYDIDNRAHSYVKYDENFIDGCENIGLEFTRQDMWKNGYPWGKLFRCDIIMDNNLRFEERLNIHEDQLFIFQYLTFAQSLYVASSTAYHYLVIDTSDRKLSNKPSLYKELLLASNLFRLTLVKLSQHLKLDQVTETRLVDIYVVGCRVRALASLFRGDNDDLDNFKSESEYWRREQNKSVTINLSRFNNLTIMLIRHIKQETLSYFILKLLFGVKQIMPKDRLRLIYADLDSRSTRCLNIAQRNDSLRKVLISHPTGNSNVRGAVNGLKSFNLLHSFHTSVSCFKGGWLYSLSMLPPFREFRKRSFSTSLDKYTYNYPFVELGRMAAIKLKIDRWLRHESGRFCVDKVYREMDQSVASFADRFSDEYDVVYCYEDCAMETFRTAKKNGKKRIYDLPIGYWRTMRKLLEMEHINRPEWAMTLGGFNDSDEKLFRKDQELAMADKIYVASSFTKRTLDDYPGKLADVEVIPYGFPVPNEQRYFEPIENRKIKMLFVGGLSQRKGLANIFEAIAGLEDRVELTVVGLGNIAGCSTLREYLDTVIYTPSLPHNEVLKLMSTQDLLLFPTLFEGFGLVITESMSQGTPVITTERGCGPDVITHGRDGWIVEAGSSEALREQILELIDAPQLIVRAGMEAIKSAKCRPWSVYERELAQSVAKFINS